LQEAHLKNYLIAIVAISVILVGMSSETSRSVCKSKYAFSTDCTACHLPPTGEVAEKLPDDVKLHGDQAYLYVEAIDFQRLRDRFLALKKRPVKTIVIDLYSHGGSLFDALAMVALIGEEQKAGRTVEIRARGIVASAGLVIMVSGTEGRRFIDKHSLVMFHELSSFKFFAVETPSDKEEEAKIFRMIQDKVNSYIGSRSKISADELCEKIKKKEFWMDAETTVKYGFADQIIN
jgi:ATP-dependent protease ClpP protease subunit